MGSRLPRGFRTEAERVARDYRRALGLTVHDRLDPFALAEYLNVRVLPLHAVTKIGMRPDRVATLASPTSGFSAVTVCCGDLRFLVYNSTHPPTRTANSVTHELSHVICKHPPLPPLGVGGCRQWDARFEEEADCLSSTLLVPRDGAFHRLQRDGSFAAGAEHFGVSEQLFRWRAHTTGVVRVLGLLRAG